MPRTPKQAGKGNGSTAKFGFEAKLWAAADALRNNMDAAEYKHVVLGLIFLKYISDAFEAKHAELDAQRKQGADPEDPDEYRAVNIFWVPTEARWSYLKAQAPQPTIGQLVDDAMSAIERDNPSLKGVLPKDYARPGLDKQRLGQLINLVSDIALGSSRRPRQGHARPRLRIFPRPFRQRRGQERRPVLYAVARRPRAGRDARALQGPRLRPLLRLRRHVRAEREIHRGPRRQARRHLDLRPGVELHDLAACQDESRHSRHRRADRARRHLPQRPAPRPQGRLRARQSAVQR